MIPFDKLKVQTKQSCSVNSQMAPQQDGLLSVWWISPCFSNCTLQLSCCIICDFLWHCHGILITNLPMLSLPLQEEKWRAVLPLSSAAQGSMSSCRSFLTEGHNFIEQTEPKIIGSLHCFQGILLHYLTVITCVNVIAVRCFPQPFHSCGDKTSKVCKYCSMTEWLRWNCTASVQ